MGEPERGVEPTKLTIIIWRKPSFIRSAFGCALVILVVMAIPVINHYLLAANPWIDAMGIAFGLVLAGAAASSMADDKRRTFRNTDEAAEWVRSREWRS